MTNTARSYCLRLAIQIVEEKHPDSKIDHGLAVRIVDKIAHLKLQMTAREAQARVLASSEIAGRDDAPLYEDLVEVYCREGAFAPSKEVRHA